MANAWTGEAGINFGGPSWSDKESQILATKQFGEQQRQFNERMNFAKGQFDWQKQALGQQGGLNSMLDAYNQSFNAAKADNEARYQQMLGIANSVSGQRQADLISDYQRQSANTAQGLARTGLSNTTVAPTLQAGIQREKQSSLNRLADEMAQMKLGVIGGKKDYILPTENINTMAGYLSNLYNSIGKISF